MAVCKSLLNIFANVTLSWVGPRRVEWDLKGSIKPQDIALPDIRTFGQEIKVSSCVGNQVEDIKGLCCAGPSLQELKLATKQLKKHKKVQNLCLNPRDYKNLDDINLGNISWGIIIRCRSDLGRICAWQGNHNEAFPTAKNEDFPRADIEITSKSLLVLTTNHNIF